jgi:hypothetical protein
METLSQKQNTNKKVGSVVQMVEYLPTMCEALGEIHRTIKKKKEKSEPH